MSCIVGGVDTTQVGLYVKVEPVHTKVLKSVATALEVPVFKTQSYQKGELDQVLEVVENGQMKRLAAAVQTVSDTV